MSNFIEIIKNQKYELERLFKIPGIIDRKQREFIDVNSPLAQIAVGVRRSGKSVLCRLALKEAQVNFGYVDFDDEALANVTAGELDDVFQAALVVYGEFEHLFLDEIQNVSGWELFVNRLLRRGMHLVVTGSNSKLLWGELATHLTGRFLPTEVLPFTFAEYRRFCGRGLVDTTEDRAEVRRDYEEYFFNGGFPETFMPIDRRAYFKVLYDSILKRDIIQRHRVRKPKLLSDLAFTVMSNCGCEASAQKFARLFGEKGTHTIQDYLRYLEEGYLILTVPQYGCKAYERTRIGKVYAIDLGMAGYFSGFTPGDDRRGRRLENLVYLQLRNCSRKLDYEIFYCRESAFEIDFLCVRLGRVVKLVQVAWELSDEKTRIREMKALFAGAEKFGCDDLLLVTDHENGEEKRGDRTVRIVDAPTWLLEMEQDME